MNYCPSCFCQALCHGCISSGSIDLSLSLTLIKLIFIILFHLLSIFMRENLVGIVFPFFSFLFYETVQRRGVSLTAPNQRSALRSSIAVSCALHSFPQTQRQLSVTSLCHQHLGSNSALTIQTRLTCGCSSPYPEPCHYPVFLSPIGPSLITAIVNYSGLVRHGSQPDAQRTS